MENKSKIEQFFQYLNFDIANLFNALPLGVIILNDKWEVIYSSKATKELFSSINVNKIIDDENLFKFQELKNILPFTKILELQRGNSFEYLSKTISTLGKEIYVQIKGSPIFNQEKFNGGILLLNDYTKPQKVDELEIIKSNFFTNFLQNICQCYLICDNTGKVIYKSTKENNRCGFLNNSEDQNVSQLFNISSSEKISQIFNNVIQNKKSAAFELNYYSDNERISFNTVVLPLKQKDEVNFILMLFKEKFSNSSDVISSLNNVEELREYHLFASSIADIVFKFNLKGEISFWIDNTNKLIKIEKEELNKIFFSDIFPAITSNVFENIRAQLLRIGKWNDILTTSKNYNEILLDTNIVKIEKNNQIEFIGYCIVTNEKEVRLKAAQEEETQFFREAVLKSDEIILQISPNGSILFANNKFCEELNYLLDEVQGVNFLELIDENFKDQNEINNFLSLVQNQNINIIPVNSKIGTTINYCITTNITTENNELKYFTTFLKPCKREDDILTNLTLELFNESEEPMVVLYQQKIYLVNNTFLELFKITNANDIVNKDFTDFILESERTKINQYLQQKGKESLKLNFNIEGKAVTLGIKKVAEKFDYQVVQLKSFNNEIVLQENNLAYLEKLTLSLRQFLWSAKLIDNEIKFEFVSPGINKIIGYSHNNFFENNNFWKEIIHPNDIDNFNKDFKIFFDNSETFEQDFSYRILSKRGEIVWICNKINVIRDDNGNVLELFGSISDITDKVIESEELKNKVKELEKLNNTKDKFISIISHDLKSPFTSIIGFAELITSDTSLTKDEIVEYVGNIKDASLHTLNLLNSLLDWTRLQTGRIDITPKTVNANQLVRKTTETLSGLALQKGIQLSSDVNSSIFIQADEGILVQVFNNLVANSIKFTNKGGNIFISAHKLPNSNFVQFSVKDTGVGIEEDDLQKLFKIDEKFTTLGTEGERGTGLGLSLVKEIIEKHKGVISVKSKVNKGTEFIFTIPISSPSIIVIDNLQYERILYSKLIQSLTENIPVYHAEDFEKAKKIIEEKIPLIIVSENKINNITLNEFYKSLNQSKLNYKPIFIILSRDISKDEVSELKNIGIELIFRKPVDIKLLKTALDKIISGN